MLLLNVMLLLGKFVLLVHCNLFLLESYLVDWWFIIKLLFDFICVRLCMRLLLIVFVGLGWLLVIQELYFFSWFFQRHIQIHFVDHHPPATLAFLTGADSRYVICFLHC